MAVHLRSGVDNLAVVACVHMGDNSARAQVKALRVSVRVKVAIGLRTSDLRQS